MDIQTDTTPSELFQSPEGGRLGLQPWLKPGSISRTRFQSPEGGRLGLQHAVQHIVGDGYVFQSPEGGRLGLQPTPISAALSTK